MRAFAIDDEQAMLDELHEAIVAAELSAEVHDFKRAKPAITAIKCGCVPDVVFSDIELPGMSGLVLASSLKEAAPDTKIVFVTAYPDYAVEAFRLHADGFVVKPVEMARVREELDALFESSVETPPSKLSVRCFGSFDVFFGASPVMFSRTQAKELLAFLVDRVGGTCTWQDFGIPDDDIAVIVKAIKEAEADKQDVKQEVKQETQTNKGGNPLSEADVEQIIWNNGYGEVVSMLQVQLNDGQWYWEVTTRGSDGSQKTWVIDPAGNISNVDVN
jgi:DNA-binding response OmpR family regulator